MADVVPQPAQRSRKAYETSVIVPDDSGTALVMWSDQWREDISGGPSVYHSTGHFARVPADAGSASLLPLPEDISPAKGAMGEQNTLYVGDGEWVWALDALSGALRWSGSGGDILATTAGGGVVVQSADTRATYDGNGTLLSSMSAAPDTTLGDANGMSNDSTSVSAHSLPNAIDYASVGWNSPEGSSLEGAAPPSCVPPVHPYRLVGKAGKPHSLVFNYHFTFETTGSFGVPLDERLIVIDAATTWQVVGGFDRDLQLETESHPDPVALRIAQPLIKKATLENKRHRGQAVFDREFADWRSWQPRFDIAKWGIVIDWNLRSTSRNIASWPSTSLVI